MIAIYTLLCISFLVYSAMLYLQPQHKSYPDDITMHGKLIYQKYNCQSCHQIYGLGGYLGPDLTNVISAEGKGENLVRIMVSEGVRQMPSFELDQDEMDALIAFLKNVDSSGVSDPRQLIIQKDGMIAQP